ncbi:hypothetical protein C0J52_00998 [Blattella germanica]|nr:hypothetical protein C0J52_00998 [Blattella germanica]
MATVQEQVQGVQGVLWLVELQYNLLHLYNGISEPDMDVILLGGNAFDSETINSEPQGVCYE